jgi:hypothetical protein
LIKIINENKGARSILRGMEVKHERKIRGGKCDLANKQKKNPWAIAKVVNIVYIALATHAP